MKVSFDGMRTNATHSMNRLHDTIKEIIDNDDLFDNEKRELIDNFNNAAMAVDIFNCLYDDDVDGDMNNMEELSIERLDKLEEE